MQVFKLALETGEHNFLVDHRSSLGRQHSNMSIPSTNIDQKLLETEFLIAICRLTGDRWQSKTLFLAILICIRQLLRVFDCHLPGMRSMSAKVCRWTQIEPSGNP